MLVEVDNELLDEYECKFIDCYNCIEPNGYNIRSGGAVSCHSEESRKRMSIAKLGVKNHNFGKPRTEAVRLAISEAKSGERHHFFGKKFGEEHKLTLALSHRKSHIELPMYVVYVAARPKQYQSAGFAVVNHPTLKNKYFTSKKISEEDKRELAIAYLNSA